MKVSILSMQHVDNYGSVLQAYSLKKNLESLGHEVYFLDIIAGDNDKFNYECAQKAVLDVSKSTNKVFLISRLKNKLRRKKVSFMYRRFRVQHLYNRISSEILVDTCIIGSDEVFNCMQRSKWGFSSQLFGDVTTANKVITYAASCGSTKSNMLSKELKNEISKAMENIVSFSVRDNNTAEFVNSLLGKKSVINLDPVAIEDFSEEIRNIDLSKKLPPRYCIIYSYEGRMSDENLLSRIREYCVSQDMVPLAFFGKQKGLQSAPILTPFEILKAFELSEAVITDTFHGTLFGAKFATKMAIVIRKSNENKLLDLVQRLCIDKHVMNDINQLEDKLSLEIDSMAINNILVEEREKAIKYLSENI